MEIASLEDFNNFKKEITAEFKDQIKELKDIILSRTEKLHRKDDLVGIKEAIEITGRSKQTIYGACLGKKIRNYGDVGKAKYMISELENVFPKR